MGIETPERGTKATDEEGSILLRVLAGKRHWRKQQPPTFEGIWGRNWKLGQQGGTSHHPLPIHPFRSNPLEVLEWMHLKQVTQLLKAPDVRRT